MQDPARAMTRAAWQALGGTQALDEQVQLRGISPLASIFPVAAFASATVATAGLAVAELIKLIDPQSIDVCVDRRLSAIWFRSSVQPIDWTAPPPWDPIAGDYRCMDGWIRLHTNAPRHRAAALHVLGAQANREDVARKTAAWVGVELENAIVSAGGCAAEMRSTEAWQHHPQGSVVAREPLACVTQASVSGAAHWLPSVVRPLEGIRVLDLTRVLAGPCATRFLAGFGAEVLRIDPPDWDEPGVVPDVTLGKRCARLDLRSAADKARFETLLTQADVLVHGYRPGALDALGFAEQERRRLAPALVEVSLDAYGWHGPWADRRGFDSLVQMSSGIADAGMRAAHAEQPVPLPVQALDHGTGYLMAAAAIRGITQRLQHGVGSVSRLSLARTAAFLLSFEGDPSDEVGPAATCEADWQTAVERTEWGSARRARPPLALSSTPMHWDLPASSLGSAQAAWTQC